ncbi:MAG: hypothetical protein QM731_23250 [Chitinophagaceae bacterium]
MTSFRQQLWVVFKLWIIAVAINTIAGTIILTNTPAFQHDADLLLIFGTLYGAIYAFPVALVLLLVINACCRYIITGMWLFWIVLISGSLCTIATFLVFAFTMGSEFHELYLLFISAFLSCTFAVASQYKPLHRMGSEHAHAEDFSF